jgi:hypothetical protein
MVEHTNILVNKYKYWINFQIYMQLTIMKSINIVVEV